VAAQADAVVVGSAVVNQIAKFGSGPGLVQRVTEFVKPLVQAVKS
jgi:tryptophan synthase alpha subunit